MCTQSCIEFVTRSLSTIEVDGRSVLEVGALDVNGSVRPVVEALGPASYVGVDLSEGPGVDEVCDVADLVRRFGRASFDLVLSTEMLEHVADWRLAVTNLKDVIRPGGLLLLTTRAERFPYHGYPYDFWRYEKQDLRDIFFDFVELVVEDDSEAPGVFMKARKPLDHHDPELANLALYSILTGRRHTSIESVLTALAPLAHLEATVHLGGGRSG